MWIDMISNTCHTSGRVFNGSGKPIDRGPNVLAEDYLDIMGKIRLQVFEYKVNVRKGQFWLWLC